MSIFYWAVICTAIIRIVRKSGVTVPPYSTTNLLPGCS